MEKYKLVFILLGVLLGIWLASALDGCNNVTYTPVHSWTDTVKTVDTVYIPAKGGFAKPDTVYKDSVVLLPVIVDSAQVAKDFYTQHYNTYKYADSLLTLTIQDTLFKNRITGRGIKYTAKLLEVVKTNSITVHDTVRLKPRFVRFGVGVLLGFGTTRNLTTLSPTANVCFRRVNLAIGYNVGRSETLFNINYFLGKR